MRDRKQQEACTLLARKPCPPIAQLVIPVANSELAKVAGFVPIVALVVVGALVFAPIAVGKIHTFAHSQHKAVPIVEFVAEEHKQAA